jgi:hypothetical protein
LTRLRLLSIAAVALLGTAVAAGCGGGGGDEDPQQVLDETFSNDETVNSGVLDLSLSASAEGEEGGNIDASVSGPFQGDEQQEGEFPQFDLTVDASGEGQGQGFDFEGGLIATSDQAFVTYQDSSYEVPAAFFNQIKQASEQAQRQAQQQGDAEDAGALFEQLGVDPSGWLTNLENEGDEDVEGAETIHIHGDADVPAILDDLQGVAAQAGGEAIDPDEAPEVEESVDEASIDVYSGKDDRILRRLDLNLSLTPAEDSDATVDNVDVEFSLTLSDVNAEQTIEAPSDAQPFSGLEQALGLPPGILEGALSGELGGGLGGGALGGSGGLGGGGGGGAGGGGGNAIAKCLQNATSEQQINDCLTQ